MSVEYHKSSTDTEFMEHTRNVCEVRALKLARGWLCFGELCSVLKSYSPGCVRTCPVSSVDPLVDVYV